MILPLFDDNSDRRTLPLVNYALIALNIFVFVFCQHMAEDARFTMTWSTVPKEILTGQDIQTEPKVIGKLRNGEQVIMPGLEQTPISVYLTLFTSMFMHGGLGHILGNMLFLWIFGDNVEDRLGHARYLLFYLACGIAASLAHVAVCVMFQTNLLTPSLGASGAISGVMGAYAFFFPNKSVTVLMFRFITTVPAFVAVGLWFLFQVISGSTAVGGKQGGGVAYGAHIGGFLFGIPLGILLDARRKNPQPEWLEQNRP
ncbi:MAG: rhomboid family intramembrane serine protease [Gemmataceae bacterium]|nr:rhomboid family intramembrane serine protease [Gemmataceae bacterium]